MLQPEEHVNGLSIFRRLRRERPWLGLGAGAVLFVTGVGLRWSLGPLSEGIGPMTFLPAILLAGVFGGLRVGLVVALICILTGWVWFFSPYGTLKLAPRDMLTMAVFTLTAVLELYVIRVLKLAIDDSSRARERSNTLFGELQHRVANNLQFVAALLSLSKRSLGNDRDGVRALEAAQTRLELMSGVHRRLHDPDAVAQPVGPHLRQLCADLIKASEKPGVRLIVTAEPIVLELETLMSVSLIVAELVTNSLKHAFRGRDEGYIDVGLALNGRTCTLTVRDDGPGLPTTQPSASGSDRLGQNILQSLAAQLRGKLSFEPGSGTTARLFFPI
ncbi:MAG: histidine kinase dimerization/phosphoacceptor domain -containing protein [Caulobacteraceae bacterium]